MQLQLRYGGAAQCEATRRKNSASVSEAEQDKQKQQKWGCCVALQAVRPVICYQGERHFLQERRSCTGSILCAARSMQLLEHLDQVRYSGDWLGAWRHRQRGARETQLLKCPSWTRFARATQSLLCLEEDDAVRPRRLRTYTRRALPDILHS